MTQFSGNDSLPEATTDLARAKADMDKYGYCMLANVLSSAEVAAIRERLMEQKAAESELGVAYHGADKKQIIKFLVNKGQVFRDILFHSGVRALVDHVLGAAYQLSSFHAHFAHPGGTKAFHTDQFWMPPPVVPGEPTRLRPGDITRTGNRGHHVSPEIETHPKAIAPAFVCNAMWMIDDFKVENGATVVVPGSHLSGRQPDAELDSNARWVPAVGPAGTVVVFEGRTWHSTGENVTDQPRIGLTTNFCAPQMRQQENFLLGTSPEVLAGASEELRELIGFKAWQGYGGYEDSNQWVAQNRPALGELKPEGATESAALS